MVGSLVLLMVMAQDDAFRSALAKLSSTDGITVSFVDRLVSGSTESWTVSLRKPNLIMAKSDTHTFTADGSKITLYDRRSKTYTSEPQTSAAIKEFLQRPEHVLTRLFLDPAGEWLKTAKQARSRKRRGVSLSGTQITLGKDQTATVYVSTGDGAINFIQVDVGKRPNLKTHLLDEIKVEHKTLPVSAFVFVPSPGDRDAAAVAAPKVTGAEKDLAEGRIPYRQLTWADFATVGTGRPGIRAHTKTFLRWNYEWLSEQSEGGYRASVKSIEIRSGLNTNETWRVRNLSQSELNRLLPHEQGHLDINEIQARKLRRLELADWPTGIGGTDSAAHANLTAQIKKIMDRALAEATSQNALYDSQTNHGQIADAQRQWLDSIRRQMRGGVQFRERR